MKVLIFGATGMVSQGVLQAARQRAGRVVLESKDIVALARS